MTHLIRALRRRAALAVSGVDGDRPCAARRLADSARTAGRHRAVAARDAARPVAHRARTAALPLADASRSAARSLPPATRRSARDLASLARAVAFWLGIALPSVHVPLLLAAGFTERTAVPLVVLWTLHAFALLFGARHDPRRT